MSAQAREMFPAPIAPIVSSGHHGSLRLSHSRKQVMVTCGRKYQLQYIERLEPIAKSSNLIFGSAVHSALAQFLTARAFDLDCDLIGTFQEEWKTITSKEVIEYSTGWDAQSMEATAIRLLLLFINDWTDNGWTVVLDPQGVPVIEREMLVRLPNGDTYIAIIDVMVRDLRGRIIVIDFKTPAQESPEDFVSLSDQLMGYQLTCDANAPALGITQVDHLAFYELLKKKIPKTARGEGPVIHLSTLANRRSQEDIQAFVRELMFVARDIREKRFAKRSMDAYSTPCGMCSFLSECISGDRSGLIVRPQRNFRAMEPAKVIPF